MTYTLITATSPGGVTVLIGSPRDGDAAGLDRAIAGHREMERAYRGEEAAASEIDLIPGCLLTDEAPDDDSRIIWSGNEGGWLVDERGTTYAYAVRA